MSGSRVLMPTEEVVVPVIVAEAMKIEFGVPVTAYLCCAAFQGYCAIGLVFGDRFGRFDDGDGIRTSTVLSMKTIHGYAVLETLNSWYIVCTWANEETWSKPPGSLH